MAEEKTIPLLLIGIMLTAVATRFYALELTGGIWHADELYQYIEQAHRLVFGYGIIPWEYADGARSWFYPLIISGVFRASIFLGVGDIWGMVFFVRLLSAVFSILVVYLTYLLGRRIYGVHVGLLAAFMTTFSIDLLDLTARVVSDVPSMFFSVLSVYLLYAGLEDDSRKRVFFAGVALGVSFMFRFPTLILLIPLIAYALVHKKFRGLRFFITGVVVILFFQGILDYITWGSFLHSPLTYIRLNIIEDYSSLFGRYSTHFYSEFFLRNLIFIPLLFAFDKKRGTVYLTSSSGFYFLVFLFVSHKEMRFISGVIPLIFVLTAYGLIKIYYSIMGRKILKYLFVVYLSSVVYYFSSDIPKIWWAENQNNLLAVYYVGRQNDSTGLAYSMLWFNSGVYSFLHKNIPAYYLRDAPIPKDADYKLYKVSIPINFSSGSIEEILSKGEVNYMVLDGKSILSLNDTLASNNFTEVKAFDNVFVFKRK